MTEENSYYMDYYLVITWLLPGYYKVLVYLYIYKICVYALIWNVRHLQNPCLPPHLEPFHVPQQHKIWHKIGSTHLYT